MRKLRDLVVCARPQEAFGYFGWPTVARLGDGSLLVGASGLRRTHICPWGRSVVCRSEDGGQSWGEPVVVNNTPLDDRDVGLVSLGGSRVALTWFTSNTRVLLAAHRDPGTGRWDEATRRAGAVMDAWTPRMCEETIGSFVRVSEDGGEAWGEVRRAPVSSPHGFTVLRDGTWLYLGKRWLFERRGLDTLHAHDTPILAAASSDEGRTWELRGTVPLPAGVGWGDCHEPHVLELPDGALLGALRVHCPFHSMLTRSSDGGRTWSAPEMLAAGSPPHLLRHSSGAVVVTYGYRQAPFGQRARVSLDDGRTWGEELTLRDDGVSGDLGYPSSVELSDGSILTVYYQALPGGGNCALLGTVWEL